MTRKRMVKQMMSTGYSRNDANCFAVYIQIRNLKYEDWNESLNEIISNSDETIKRYDEMREMNDRAFELARRTNLLRRILVRGLLSTFVLILI